MLADRCLMRVCMCCWSSLSLSRGRTGGWRGAQPGPGSTAGAGGGRRVEGEQVFQPRSQSRRGETPAQSEGGCHRCPVPCNKQPPDLRAAQRTRCVCVHTCACVAVRVGSGGGAAAAVLAQGRSVT